MKDQELDRLFRHKLGELEKEPTLQAWEQLNKQLQQKKRGEGWVLLSGIAASLLLFAGLWASFEYSSYFIPADPLAQQSEEEIPTPPHKINIATKQETAIPERTEKRPSAKNTKETSTEVAVNKEPKTDILKDLLKPGKATNQASGRHTAKKETDSSDKKAIAVESLSPDPEIAIAESENPADHLIAETVPTETKASGAEKNEKIIIRYNSLDKTELNDRPSEQLAQENPQEENDLSARKIIGFLKKVKSNNSGNLAELREAKDELFSFRLGKTNSD